MHLNYLGAVYPKNTECFILFFTILNSPQVTLLVGNCNGLLLYPLYTWVMSKTLSFLFTASIDGPTLTHHYYPEVIVYIRFTLVFAPSVGVDKCIMTCIHHYNTIQSNFTAYKSSVLHFPRSLTHEQLIIILSL